MSEQFLPKKYIYQHHPKCLCKHEYYDHDLGNEVRGGSLRCEKCTCDCYTLVMSKIKDKCSRCYNKIPKGKIHKKVSFWSMRGEKCIEIG